MKRTLDNPNQLAFLAAYAELGNISAAAKATGVNRSNHYAWLEDAEYNEAFKMAHEEACEALETEARRRAVEGVEEPLVYQGQFSYKPKLDEDGKIMYNADGFVMYEEKPLTVRKPSDTLLIFLMKGAMPTKYRDNATLEVTGNLNIIERLAAGRQRVREHKESGT